jgi:hypothetical protein
MHEPSLSTRAHGVFDRKLRLAAPSWGDAPAVIDLDISTIGYGHEEIPRAKFGHASTLRTTALQKDTLKVISVR